MDAGNGFEGLKFPRWQHRVGSNPTPRTGSRVAIWANALMADPADRWMLALYGEPSSGRGASQSTIWARCVTDSETVRTQNHRVITRPTRRPRDHASDTSPALFLGARTA